MTPGKPSQMSRWSCLLACARDVVSAATSPQNPASNVTTVIFYYDAPITDEHVSPEIVLPLRRAIEKNCTVFLSSKAHQTLFCFSQDTFALIGSMRDSTDLYHCIAPFSARPRLVTE